VGKLAIQGRLNAVAPGALVHIQDQLSKRRFLVDTGASFSIFPHHSSAPASGPVLSGPSGKTIPCWDEKFLTLSFHGKTFTWTFLLAAVQFPILGVDFLRHYKLLVDPAANRLVDTRSKETFAAIPAHGVPTASPVSLPSAVAAAAGCSPPHCTLGPQHTACGPEATPPQVPHHPSSQDATCGKMTARLAAAPSVKAPPGSLGAVPHVATCGQPPGIADLLSEFATVVNEDKSLPAATHDVLHHITTTGPPLTAKFPRQDGEKLATAQAEFTSLERDGIVRRSDSPWASPLHMVRKKDGGWRPCGDFRRLNLVTVPDSYPLPNMMDVATKMAGCRVFSKVDLRKGITRSQSTHLIFPRRPSPRRSGYSSTCACPSVSGMRAIHSSA
jgi:hypothetical protein